jgi:outer membrane protein, heavy metal efflux system
VKSRSKAATLVVASALLVVSGAAAEEALPCSRMITRKNVVACALGASLVVKGERQELEAARGRKLAASPILPSNPILSVSGSRRAVAGMADTTNWYASLAQEVELSGQRSARRQAADAEIAARLQRTRLSQRDVAGAAWLAFFDALAAREEAELAAELAAVTQGVSVVARARADKGLIAPVDADVAEAATVRVVRAQMSANRRLREARSRLASLVGLDPAVGPPPLHGALEPIPGVDGLVGRLRASTELRRPELLALDAERKALELRASAHRRARIPNPTISVFAQNDGFNERVLGLGVSLPIPLPGNVGHTFIGEIAEAEALSRRAVTERARVRREIRLAIVTASDSYESLLREVRGFGSETLERARASLRSLREEVEAGRLGVRDAVAVQQALVELLQADVATRRALCFASVELARTLGFPLEKAAP